MAPAQSSSLCWSLTPWSSAPCLVWLVHPQDSTLACHHRPSQYRESYFRVCVPSSASERLCLPPHLKKTVWASPPSISSLTPGQLSSDILVITQKQPCPPLLSAWPSALSPAGPSIVMSAHPSSLTPLALLGLASLCPWRHIPYRSGTGALALLSRPRSPVISSAGDLHLAS